MLSILDWENAWSHDQPFPFTPSVAEMNGLDAALDVYLDEGPEAVWKRHGATASACRAGVQAMGLKLWAAREAIASPTTTAVRVPDGISTSPPCGRPYASASASPSRPGAARPSANFCASGIWGRQHSRSTRLPRSAALGGALNHLGHRADVGAGVAATVAAINTQHDRS